MKIVYCTDSICYAGGIQTVTICKANALALIPNNTVWIIVTDNKERKLRLLNDAVHLIDLNINYFEDDWKSKYHLIKGFFIKRREHKKKLREILNKIAPDVVISTGTSEKNFIPTLKIQSNPVFIREIHSVKNYRTLSAKNIFDKFIAYVGNLLDYHYHIRKYDKVVVLTEEDKRENWRDVPYVTAIPNPITINIDTQHSSLMNKTVIAVGRLVEPKNFQSLIRAWRIVYQKHPDWELHIWGSGHLQNSLQELIDLYKLQKSVSLKGYTYDIRTEMLKDSIYVLSSVFEGLPLVILEAMSCGLPVVSYTCPCGPKDIITDGKDGFLVPVNDESKLAEKICYLIEHDTIRKEMGRNAFLTAKEYSIEKIVDIWMTLFYQLKK